MDSIIIISYYFHYGIYYTLEVTGDGWKVTRLQL